MSEHTVVVPPELTVGRRAVLTHVVRAEDTAAAWGNELPVLATPVLLWLSEIAAMQAVQDDVEAPWMTVGAHHDTSHAAPTPTGATLTVTASLAVVDGRRLVFDVDAHDGERTVMRGRHTRGVVHADVFRARYGI